MHKETSTRNEEQQKGKKKFCIWRAGEPKNTN